MKLDSTPDDRSRLRAATQWTAALAQAVSADSAESAESASGQIAELLERHRPAVVGLMMTGRARARTQYEVTLPRYQLLSSADGTVPGLRVAVRRDWQHTGLELVAFRCHIQPEAVGLLLTACRNGVLSRVMYLGGDHTLRTTGQPLARSALGRALELRRLLDAASGAAARTRYMIWVGDLQAGLGSTAHGAFDGRQLGAINRYAARPDIAMRPLYEALDGVELASGLTALPVHAGVFVTRAMMRRTSRRSGVGQIGVDVNVGRPDARARLLYLHVPGEDTAASPSRTT